MQNVDLFIGRLGSKMFHFAFTYAEMKRRGLDGHFPHSPHWFADCEDEILSLFRLGVGSDSRVAVHVRRGDFCEEWRVHGLLPESYYRAALALFPSERFLVFCRDRQSAQQDARDREWCQKFFQAVVPGRFDFWEGPNEYADMNRMASCQHQIIANSTFSCWAALLNPNPNKRVVYPSPWDKTNWEPQLPSNWSRVRYV